MNNNVTAFGNIAKKTEKLISLSVIIIVITLIISITFLSLSFQKMKTLQTIKQELQTVQQSQQNTDELRNYISSNSQIIISIDSVFPNEANIDQVYNQLSELVETIDDNGKITFGSIIPTQVNQQAALPMRIELSSSQTEIIDFLKNLERFPNIIEVYDVTITEPLSKDGHAIILFRLYVDDQFTQP
jgi:uncharacterized protein YydD (DUF2326 family)